MKRLLNYKYLMLFTCLTLGSQLNGQTFENSRSLRKAYRIAPNVEVQVINKYGDIHLVPWEKDSVVFEIDFSAISNKQAKVDKIFDYIDFEFKSTAYYVIAQTVFEGQDNIWSEMADVASTIFSSGTNTKIDYTVYFPEGNDVKIENKFGNIYTTDHSGKVDINLSNGDLKGNNFNGPARLKVEFGNVTLDQVINATITLGYAEINLDKAGEISFETRSSKLFLNNCDILQVDSKRDKYYIKSAAELNGSGFFSYFSLDMMTSRINLKTDYGDFKLFDTGENFRSIDLTSQYTDITIYLDDQHLFEFDIIRDDRSQVITSSSVISSREEPAAGTDKSFRGYISAGKAGKPIVPVTINIKSGKIYLMRS